MTLQISFKHMLSNEILRSHTQEKSSILGECLAGRVHLLWNFSIQGANRIARCHLLGKRMDYFAEATSDDFFSSIDETAEKLEKQIRHRNQLLRQRRQRFARRVEFPTNEEI